MKKNDKKIELKRILANPFKTKGKKKLSKESFVFSLALDMNWFSTEDARKILSIGIERGYLKEDDGNIFPDFSLNEVEISLSYSPNKEILEEIRKEVGSIFDKVIKKIQNRKEMSKQDIIAEANKIQSNMAKLVDIETALILTATKYGIEVGDLATKKLEKEFDGF